MALALLGSLLGSSEKPAGSLLPRPLRCGSFGTQTVHSLRPHQSAPVGITLPLQTVLSRRVLTGCRLALAHLSEPVPPRCHKLGWSHSGLAHTGLVHHLPPPFGSRASWL